MATKQELLDSIIKKIFDNNQGRITATDMKNILVDIVDKYVPQDEVTGILDGHTTDIDNLVSEYVTQIEQYSDEAKTAAGVAGSVFEDKGPYDAFNNIPTLTAVVPSGSLKSPLYTVTVSGSAKFVGNNFTQGTILNIGDELRGISGSWYRRPFTDLALTKATFIQKDVYSSSVVGNSIFSGSISGLSDITKCYLQQGKILPRSGYLTKIKIGTTINGGFNSRTAAIVVLRRNDQVSKYVESSKNTITLINGLQEVDLTPYNITVQIGDIIAVQPLESNLFLSYSTVTGQNYGLLTVSQVSGTFEASINDVTTNTSNNNQTLWLDATISTSNISDIYSKFDSYPTKVDLTGELYATQIVGNSIFSGSVSGSSDTTKAYLQQGKLVSKTGVATILKIGAQVTGGFTTRNIGLVVMRPSSSIGKYLQSAKYTIPVATGVQSIDLTPYNINVVAGDAFAVQPLQSNLFLWYSTVPGQNYGVHTVSQVSGSFEATIQNVTTNNTTNFTQWLDVSIQSPYIDDIYTTFGNYTTKTEVTQEISSELNTIQVLGNSIFSGSVSGFSDLTKAYVQQTKIASQLGYVSKMKLGAQITGGFTSRNLGLVVLRRNNTTNTYQEVSKTVIPVGTGVQEIDLTSYNIAVQQNDAFGIQPLQSNLFLWYSTIAGQGYGAYTTSQVSGSFEATIPNIISSSFNGQSLWLDVSVTTPYIDDLYSKIDKTNAIIPAVTVGYTNQFNVSNIELNKYVNTSGYVFNTGTDFVGSGYIAVTPSTQIKIKGVTPILGYKGLQFSDASKVILPGTPGVTLRADIFVDGEFTVNIPAGCYFIYFTVRVPDSLGEAAYDYSTVLVRTVGGTETITKLNGRALSATTLETGATLGGNPVATTPTKVSMSVMKPTRIFTVCNDIQPTTSLSYTRNYASAIYADHMLDIGAVNKNIYIKETGNDKYVFYSPVDENGGPTNNNQNVYKVNKSFTLTGDIIDIPVTIQQVSTKASVGKSTQIRLHQIGDSNTYGPESAYINVSGSYPAKAYEFVKMYYDMDKIDAGNPSGDYNLVLVGASLLRGTSFTYKGTTINSRSVAEGNNGWSAFTYLYHTDLRTASQGVWDLLGLGNGSGTDYTGTTQQINSVYSTREGLNVPTNTAAFVTYMNGLYGGISNYTQAVAKATDLLSNPLNKYFDKDKVGSNAFSFAKYMERYKTLADDGITRLNVGTTAGSKVTNIMAWDMCLPTHVFIQLGTNDRNKTSASTFAANIQVMVNDIKAFDSTINVGFHMPDSTGTYFPKLYPEFNELSTLDAVTHTSAIAFNTQLQAIDSDVNKAFFIPGYFIQPTAYGTPVRNTHLAESVGQTYNSEKLHFYVRHTNASFLHLSNNANAAIAYQVYGWIKYSLSL